MKKYACYGKATVSWFIGEFEANSKKEAVRKAVESEKAEPEPLCCQCSCDLNIGDTNSIEVEEINEE